MVSVRSANTDLTAAILRSIALEVEMLLKAIEENDVVMYQDFDTRLKKIILSINLLRRGLQERRLGL